jgi:hypothetical protein
MNKNDLSSVSQYQHSLEAKITMHLSFQLLEETLIAARYDYESNG